MGIPVLLSGTAVYQRCLSVSVSSWLNVFEAVAADQEERRDG
jgi:hypothetical protein